ncbi:S8 family serine peptidase [Tsukamurella strandjordii]|uniref:S8 family serine peptidase n=1 Tax=Tsukamurella strandjordii TaxID=147577 RepID=A0AA90NHT0_9ACTN|nr:S8 family serine peptidase [Tsukamurella strandjordii]MDP0398606.1 S8 family serine peptidase [Tsukamurella strandjordii]
MIAIDGVPNEAGRYVLVFPSGSDEYGRVLRRVMGVSEVLRSADAGSENDLQTAGAVVFDRLGIAVVQADPDQLVSLQGASPDVLSVEPELEHYPLGVGSEDYLAGYRDGVADLTRRLGIAEPATPSGAASRFADTAEFTWGLQAVGASVDRSGGAGIKVAVLDTGFTLGHPDFADRGVITRSFVPGEDAADAHGHGTHCVGTACGPLVPAGGGRRYGVAYASQVYVGKVLANNGTGNDTGILAGIDWALGEGCQVISMSLGADVRQVSAAYERAGAAALAAGTLIVAAAGNNARRPGDKGFVGVPANSPSIMAVAAVDQALGVAPFSATSNPVAGGQVDIAAPGVEVYSSWTLPQRYNTISGTSMATPHVAGLAAVAAQVSGLRGQDLWAQLTRTAQRLDGASADVGSGLAHTDGNGAIVDS